MPGRATAGGFVTDTPMPPPAKGRLPLRRSLSYKITLSVLAVFILLLVALGFLAARILESSFDDFEQQALAAQFDRVTLLLDEQRRSLLNSATDYAHWDDTYDYLNGTGAADYVNANYTIETFNNIDIDVVALLDRDRRIVFAGSRLPPSGDPLDTAGLSATGLFTIRPAWREILATAAFGQPALPGDVQHGFIEVGGRMYLAGAVAILRTDRSGTSPGYLVMARAIEGARLDRFSTVTGCRLSLHSVALPGADSRPVVIQADGSMRMQRDLPGLDRRVVRLTVSAAPALNAQRATTRTLLIVSVAAVGIVCLLLFFALLYRQVHRRVSALAQRTAAIQQNRALRLPVAVADGDEIDQLAAATNILLDDLTASEDQLRAAKDAAEAAAEVKGRFVSIVSHELRTPLTAIHGALKLLDRKVYGPLPDQAAQLVTLGVQDTERLTRLISNVLDFQRIDANHWTPSAAPLPLAELFAAAMLPLAQLARDRQVTFAPADTGVRVLADRDAALQTFTNLFTNALNFSPAGGSVAVTVETAATEAVIGIADQGPGIPEEFQHKMFGAFEQAGTTGSRTRGGAGLGLAISRKLVERMHGRIWFTSAAGTGTTMYVALPLAPQ